MPAESCGGRDSAGRDAEVTRSQRRERPELVDAIAPAVCDAGVGVTRRITRSAKSMDPRAPATAERRTDRRRNEQRPIKTVYLRERRHASSDDAWHESCLNIVVSRSSAPMMSSLRCGLVALRGACLGSVTLLVTVGCGVGTDDDAT